jgi:hypothetical protein
VLEMEALWPSGVVLRGEASNRPVLRWLKTVVVSDREKAGLIRSGGDQEDVPESAQPRMPGWACAGEASLAQQSGVESGGSGCSLAMSLAGVPITGQAASGVKAA